MYIGKTPTVGNFQVCDAISVVNGQAAYTLQVGGVNVAPESANHMLVSLNGILQKPGSSFTISGSTMTFASNLATGDVIDFVQILGNVLDIGQPSDDTVTAAKLNNDIISGQTALTAEPDSTDELLVSDAGTIKRIDASFFQNTPAFLAHKADQSISDATETTIVCDTEVYDTNSAYDTSTGKFTVPSGEAGKYTFTLFTFIEHNNSNDYRQIYSVFQKNDGSVGYGSTHQLYHENFSNNFRGCSLSYTLTLNLAAGDTVKGRVYQDNAANASRGLEQASFSGFKLIGV